MARRDVTVGLFGQSRDPAKARAAEGEHMPFFILEGEELTLRLDTVAGRQAARMLAAGLIVLEPYLATALIARVGPEEEAEERGVA